jgi:hypothetical protein
MTDEHQENEGVAPVPSGSGWGGRVKFSDRLGGFAYRPNELLVRTAAGAERANELLSRFLGHSLDGPTAISEEWYLFVQEGINVLPDVADLEEEGLRVEPNYVLFADSAGCCTCGCGGGPWANPVYANPVYANPVYANPVYANPVYANPVYANGVYASATHASSVLASPVYANPVYANSLERAEYRASGKRTSSARPCEALAADPLKAPTQATRVAVLDTGLAVERQLPPLLDRLTTVPAREREVPSADGDAWLDPVAGHGTFITGLVELLIPGLELTPVKVLHPEGDGDQARIAATLRRLSVDDHTLINLSFSGYAPADMACLASAVRHVQRQGAVVVASTGNDGLCRPTYPACLPDVVSVAALGPAGPAPFSNHGPWVRACAPGVDVVSCFFKDFNGPIPPLEGSPDPDHFQAWARWSGTSFAAPIVVAALAREMVLRGCTAKEAVACLIDAPSLLRVPWFGTVVNLWPPGAPVTV